MGHHDTQRADHGFDLVRRLNRLNRRGLRRSLDPVEEITHRTQYAPDPGGSSPAFEEELLVFASNDYLGLAGDDRLAEAAAGTARETGTGAGASRLVCGDTPAHRALERALANSKNVERALVFSSGYAANVGTITALAPDAVFSDALNHASIIDGCRLSGADIEVYPHCDPEGLAAAMNARDDAAEEEETWLVVTDSVFSMAGDVAPLVDLAAVTDRHGAWLMVDEAHATGLYERGGGIVQREGIEDRIDIQLGTCSKALGAQGGFVAGDEALIEYLLNAARSFVFSTGLAPPAAAASRRALAIAQQEDIRRQLWSNIERMREGLVSMGFEVLGSTQILPVLIGERRDAVAFDDLLRGQGVLAPAIRPPTVPEGESRVRVAPTAGHTTDDIDAALAAFESAGSAVGLL
jgi:8-amino-7-oxononanoate synthase